jgi:hypothetical protein
LVSQKAARGERARKTEILDEQQVRKIETPTKGGGTAIAKV